MRQDSVLRFAVVGNHHQADKVASLEVVIRCLRSYPSHISIERQFFQLMQTQLSADVHFDDVFDLREAFDADFVVCLGGDGTYLKAAEMVGARHIPIFCINTGRLGYLAEVSPSGIDEAVRKLFAGAYTLEERSLIGIRESTQPVSLYPFALNEVAVLKRDNSSMISIHTSLNGEHLTTYQADGLIVSTPTGSTGYSLSVGAPVLVPQSPVFVLTAVAPHSLNMRPLVVCDDVEITLKIESRSHNFLISLDGRSERCSDEVCLTLAKAPYTLPFVRFTDKSFLQTLRSKLMWGADRR